MSVERPRQARATPANLGRPRRGSARRYIVVFTSVGCPDGSPLPNLASSSAAICGGRGLQLRVDAALEAAARPRSESCGVVRNVRWTRCRSARPRSRMFVGVRSPPRRTAPPMTPAMPRIARATLAVGRIGDQQVLDAQVVFLARRRVVSFSPSRGAAHDDRAFELAQGRRRASAGQGRASRSSCISTAQRDGTHACADQGGGASSSACDASGRSPCDGAGDVAVAAGARRESGCCRRR